MYIKKFLKFLLLICTMCLIFISVNFFIQKTIQDIENNKSSMNLIKMVTKNKDENEDDNIIIAQNNKDSEPKEEVIKSEELVSQEHLDVVEKELKHKKTNFTEAEGNVNGAKDKIDWNKLAIINKDIVGWIEIPNTNINYPILKDNNLFYLNHSFDGKLNRNGSIFIRNYNLFEGDEITIYGHNMKNGTMFAKLANYINEDYLCNNARFYIYTKETIYEGEFFSAYSKGINEEKEAIKCLDFNEKIKYYKNQGPSSENSKEDINKIVKLTTCSYLNVKKYPTDQRYYVIGKIREI